MNEFLEGHGGLLRPQKKKEWKAWLKQQQPRQVRAKQVEVKEEEGEEEWDEDEDEK